MGLETYDNSGKIFLKLKHGCLCEESKAERDGFKKVEGNLQDGTHYVKWIKPYKAVSGFVDRIEWYDREHNGRKFRGWNLHITDDDESYVLDIPFANRANSRWMKLAENIQFDEPVRFSAWNDRKTDTLAFNVQQGGTSVPQKYTRENPLDLPEPIQRSSGKWDYGAQEDFLVHRMNKNVLPACEAAASKRGVKAALSESPETNEEIHDEPDDAEEMQSLLKDIQGNLKAVAESRSSSIPVVMEESFGTRIWNDVTKMDITILAACNQKLADEIVPF